MRVKFNFGELNNLKQILFVQVHSVTTPVAIGLPYGFCGNCETEQDAERWTRPESGQQSPPDTNEIRTKNSKENSKEFKRTQLDRSGVQSSADRRNFR